ncbi:ATP-binding protein [Inhella crocodyli]|uniref:Virulence sensor protein BvgS n=1 Tax=Inhella crocodyli TaxID=2499851 RepID=A0A3S2UD03_9BURK|nr:ATP-binding protein [Inhella crocodyli]RVT84748.1 PAS domain S-box protein [Inhella crocodyli]
MPEFLRAKPGSLQFRLLAALALSAGLIVLLAGLGWQAFEQDRLDRQFQQHQTTLVELGKRGLATPLWNVDGAAVDSVLQGLLMDPAVDRIEIHAPGLPGGSLARQKPHSGPATEAGPTVAFDIDYSGTGSAGATRVGRAEMVMNQAQLRQTQRDARLFILALLAALLLTLSVVAYLWLDRLVRRRLQQVGDWSQRLAHGQWDAPMPAQAQDELGVLAEQLTHMARQIQGSAHELHVSEQRYRSLFENAGEGLFQLDHRGRLVDVNNALATMLDFGNAAQALAQSRRPTRLVRIARDDRRHIADRLARQDSVTNLPMPITTRSGRTLWVELSLHRVVADASERPLYQGMLLDITERRAAEKALSLHREELEELVQARTTELIEAKQRAEAASEAKSRFLAAMSHEFRTPLNAILSFSQLAQMNDALPMDTRRQLGLIVDSGEHLLAMITELLDLAAIEAGRLRLNLAPVQLASLAELCTDAVRLRAQAKQLGLQIKIDPQLPYRVLVDGQRLRQVLLNLLSNAVKFTDQGLVSLELRVTERTAGRVSLQFVVSDTGIGMSKAQRAHLFEPFAQVSDVAQRRSGGSGLGLTICAQLLSLMNSQLELDSAPGQGSRFSFELDLAIYEPLGSLP